MNTINLGRNKSQSLCLYYTVAGVLWVLHMCCLELPGGLILKSAATVFYLLSVQHLSSSMVFIKYLENKHIAVKQDNYLEFIQKKKKKEKKKPEI